MKLPKIASFLHNLQARLAEVFRVQFGRQSGCCTKYQLKRILPQQFPENNDHGFQMWHCWAAECW